MDSDSQESPRKEQDWTQSPLAKEAPLAGVGDWKVTLCPPEIPAPHKLIVSSLAPKFPAPRHSSPAALFGCAALSPVLSKNWCFPPPQGAAGHRTGTTRLPPISPENKAWSFPSHEKSQQKSHYFPAWLSGIDFKQISRTSYQNK